MRALNCWLAVIAASFVAAGPVHSQGEQRELPSTAERLMHEESAQRHEGAPPPEIKNPAVPEGMTVDQVLEYSANPPPQNFPHPVPDDRIRVFTFFEQLEYRMGLDEARDQLGWDAQSWVGGDFNRFWWKNEGEAVFDGPNEGEAETDLLYSRLITPFWNIQGGLQYANEWNEEDYGDRWSGVIALEGLAPYKFELDSSLYFSEDGDVTLELEAEYDIRVTQRLVLQPRTELSFAAQDIPSRSLGAGLTAAKVDLRLRYEIKREFAPYVGVRYRSLIGETHSIAGNRGEDPDQLFFLAGVRFAF